MRSSPSTRLVPWWTHLVGGGGGGGAGGQREDGQLLSLWPAGLQTVLPLPDDPGLRVRVVRHSEATKRTIYTR